MECVCVCVCVLAGCNLGRCEVFAPHVCHYTHLTICSTELLKIITFVYDAANYPHTVQCS